VVVEGEAQRLGVDQVALVGVVDGALDGDGAEFRGDVDQGSHGVGDGQVVEQLDFRDGKGRTPTDAQAGPRPCFAVVQRDVDLPGPLRPDAQEGGGAPMAQGAAGVKKRLRGEPACSLAAGGSQDGRRPAPPSIQMRPAGRIDPSRDPVKPPVREPVLDRTGAETKRQQLRPRQHPMLPRSQSPGLS
jgi:hypothetical protein